MKKSKELLTFEWNSEKEQLELHANQNGLEALKKIIESLIQKNSPDHVHLMTPAWGGGELTEEVLDPKNLLIHHVKISKWD